MAASVTKTPFLNNDLAKPTRLKLPQNQITVIPVRHKFSYIKPNPLPKFQPFPYPRRLPSPVLPPLAARATLSSSDDQAGDVETILPSTKERPVHFLLLVVLWASVSLAWFASSSDAKAAVDSIRASSFGLKIASSLLGLGWPDEAVVFSLATLPIIELRGAIPVGYWLQLNPLTLTSLSILAMDINRENYELGLPVIEKAGVAHKIDFREGPALPVLDEMIKDEENLGSFDFIFVDADKDNYINYHKRLIDPCN